MNSTRRARFSDLGIVVTTTVNVLLAGLGVVISATFETRAVEAEDFTDAMISRLAAQGFAYVLVASLVVNAFILLVLRRARRVPFSARVVYAEVGLSLSIAAWTVGLSIFMSDYELLSILLVRGGGAVAASVSVLVLVFAAPSPESTVSSLR